jgi:hypothetical protein
MTDVSVLKNLQVFGLPCSNCGADEPHTLKCCNLCEHSRLATREDVLLASGLVSTCPTCGGSGSVVAQPFFEGEHPFRSDCPDCRSGLVLNPEAVERAAKATHPPFGITHARRMAEAALWAALDTGDTE